jgi:hypothetical protein
MSKRAKVTVTASIAKDGWTCAQQYFSPGDAPEGTYALYPVGEQVYTLEEATIKLAAVLGDAAERLTAKRAASLHQPSAPSPDPAALPEAGKFYYHPEKGLAQATLYNKGLSFWLREAIHSTSIYVNASDWPGSWEGPLVTCCGEGCAFFRDGAWYEQSGRFLVNDVGGPFKAMTPCRRQSWA